MHRVVESVLHWFDQFFKGRLIVGPTNAPATGMQLTVAGNIGPEADATRNLGSSTLRMNDINVNRVLGGLGASITGSGTLNAARSDGGTHFFEESAADNQFIMPYDVTHRSRGSLASKATVVSNDFVRLIDTFAYDGIAMRLVARHTTYIPIRSGTDDLGGAYQWATRPRGLAGPLTTRFEIADRGSVIVGSQAAALATTATDGFLYIPTCAGVPTGVPTGVTGCVPLIYDTTNLRLYIYSGGAWRIH